MIMLHDYKTNEEVWCDPDLVACTQRFAALSIGTAEIPEHTRVVMRSIVEGQTHEVLRVSESPSTVAKLAGWTETAELPPVPECPPSGP